MRNEWEATAPALSLPQLDDLGTDGVNIRCINCSDFIVGKQTNFNGPVTIICCSDAWDRIREEKRQEEKDLVIREEVLSPTAATKIHRLAEERKTKEGSAVPNPNSSCFKLSGGKLAKYKIPLVAFVGLLLGTPIGLAVFFTMAVSGKDSHSECFLLANNVTCVYSGLLGEESEGEQPLSAPSKYVIVFQTHGEYCYEVSVCLDVVKTLPRNGTNDLGCNFVLGGDGNAYEGGGWTAGKAVGAFRLCFAGNFTEEDFPTYPQVVAAQALLGFGVGQNLIAKDYVLGASNATDPEDSLASIYKIISKWPRFQENPFSFDCGGTKRDKGFGRCSPENGRRR